MASRQNSQTDPRIGIAARVRGLFKAKNGKWFFVVLLAVLILIGLVVAIYSWILTLMDSRLSAADVCFSSGCLKHAQEIFSGTISVLEATGALTAWVAAVGGIVIALFSYISSSAVSAFGNHVSHISIFSSYMNYEISKRTRIASGSVDIYGMYTLMFSSSKRGSMDVSEDYKAAIENISMVIRDSNKAYSGANSEKFSLRFHQSRIKKALDSIGIKCALTHHRIDFVAIESEIFDLVDSINVVFCTDYGVGRLPAREYV